MKIEQSQLIQELRDLTHAAQAQVKVFQSYPLEQLNYKSSDSDWSVLECMEHLCLYGKFYLPEIERRMMKGAAVTKTHFKSGWIGNYFVNMIKATNTKKIKATKPMNPAGSELDFSTLTLFSTQLEWLDVLLVKAKKVNLTKVKTAISLSKFIQLRLGDTLRFLVYHNERHILQAQRIDGQYAAKAS
jgi:hypothetical protein